MSYERSSPEWRELNEKLQQASLPELEKMLMIERGASNRVSFVKRIYGRLTYLRKLKERKELGV